MVMDLLISVIYLLLITLDLLLIFSRTSVMYLRVWWKVLVHQGKFSNIWCVNQKFFMLERKRHQLTEKLNSIPYLLHTLPGQTILFCRFVKISGIFFYISNIFHGGKAYDFKIVVQMIIMSPFFVMTYIFTLDDRLWRNVFHSYF